MLLEIVRPIMTYNLEKKNRKRTTHNRDDKISRQGT